MIGLNIPVHAHVGIPRTTSVAARGAAGRRDTAQSKTTASAMSDDSRHESDEKPRLSSTVTKTDGELTIEQNHAHRDQGSPPARPDDFRRASERLDRIRTGSHRSRPRGKGRSCAGCRRAAPRFARAEKSRRGTSRYAPPERHIRPGAD